MLRESVSRTARAALCLALSGSLTAAPLMAGERDSSATATPIQHVVVIFQENISFDHYFATYPNAANTDGTPFHAKRDTPTVNGLDTSLLAPNNPNSVQPFRLTHEQFETADQDHGYKDEQAAFDNGLMDMFVEKVGRGNGPNGEKGGQVMGYYDGNTVTAVWNYAQTFALNDNSFDTVFGPSTPGALNLVSGQTHGYSITSPAVSSTGTMFSDTDPTGDICSKGSTAISVDPNNKNIGDLLNDKGITWGWFEGGFREAPGAATCGVVATRKCRINCNHRMSPLVRRFMV